MGKQLDWSLRARADVGAIEEYYAMTASPETAAMARDAIVRAAGRLGVLPATFRKGKHGERQYVMRRFPYTIIYRETGNIVRIVRVMHQARKYFNR
jgi:plasmid stabilization system protein ParE